jgi:hypothetical protein
LQRQPGALRLVVKGFVEQGFAHDAKHRKGTRRLARWDLFRLGQS